MPARGPHFFVPPSDVEGGIARVRGEDARHLAIVLRARPGQPVSIADGTGRVYQTFVRRADADEVVCEVRDTAAAPQPTPRLTVVHGLPKGRKLDDVVQRLTEIGCDCLVPVMTARSEVRLTGERAQRATARWRAVAHTAAKQSRRSCQMTVTEVGEWASAFPPGSAGAVLWEEANRPLREVLDVGARELLLGIGPEGGLTAGEVAAAGLPLATLGPTVLRTETAALVAATAALTLAGRLG